ncbi:hypothetical protein LI294_20485 [bacterium 210702-DFI.5.13]|nr:uroporphyrinogen decarboxylase family protein [uncultured Blautia sp.]MCB6589669.1 hypothetical protein [bacterium 210702-DFI.5.13]SCJ38292.1 methylcobalamin:coenzyme M methyltransferase [uncultured Blautia sp.]
MNKRERVLAAFNCQEVDRVPAGFWFHFPEDESLGEQGIQHHLDFYHQIDADFIKIMCDGYFDYPNPYIKEIKKASDWRNLKPLGKDHPFIRGQVERCRAINDALKGECCTFYNVYNPMSSMRFGCSDEMLMAHLKEDPEAVMYALDVIAEDNAALAELVITEGGCDGIYYCVQNAEEKRFTYEEYRKYVTPGDKKVLEHANKFSDNNILHCCGWAGDKNRMEVWQDYDAKVYNWAVFIEGMSLAEGREFFHHRCIMGGFDNRPQGVLYSGTKEEVQSYTKGLVTAIGKKGYIVGADCTFPRDVDVNRFTWVKDTLKEL